MIKVSACDIKSVKTDFARIKLEYFGYHNIRIQQLFINEAVAKVHIYNHVCDMTSFIPHYMYL